MQIILLRRLLPFMHPFTHTCPCNRANADSYTQTLNKLSIHKPYSYENPNAHTDRHNFISEQRYVSTHNWHMQFKKIKEHSYYLHGLMQKLLCNRPQYILLRITVFRVSASTYPQAVFPNLFSAMAHFLCSIDTGAHRYPISHRYVTKCHTHDHGLQIPCRLRHVR